MPANFAPVQSTRLEPISFLIKRGALGDSLDGRTREGKFCKSVEDELLASLGGQATAVQRLAIRRVARLTLQAELLDTKLRDFWDSGKPVSEAVTRRLVELHKAIVACIRELEPQANGRGVTGPLTLQEYLAQREGVSP
jgi:hypothetical protein